jgi:hypothetical protein
MLDSDEVCERLRRDLSWLAEHGVEVTQFGPDHMTGKVRIYLARYSAQAHRVLAGRYGSAVVVDSQPRRWRFTRQLRN